MKEIVFYLLLTTHVYLCIRFALYSTFNKSEYYTLSLMLLVFFVPFFGYFIGTKRLREEAGN